MFEKRGIIKTLLPEGLETLNEKLELELIEAGAQDIKRKIKELTILTATKDLDKIRKILENNNYKIEHAQTELSPKNFVHISPGKEKERFDKLINELEEHNDVEKIYSNLNTVYK